MRLANPFSLNNAGTRSTLHGFLFTTPTQDEEIVKPKLSVLALAAILTFSMVAGVLAQSSGAGGGTGGGTAGGAAGTGTTGNSPGVGGRGTANAPSPNLNPSNPTTVPQSNEKPVSPGAGK
jgi:hypothetical protein